MVLDALATVSGKGNFGLGRSELEQVRRTMDGYPGIKVRMRRPEAWAASSFWQQLGFLFSKRNAVFIQPENRAVADGELLNGALQMCSVQPAIMRFMLLWW